MHPALVCPQVLGRRVGTCAESFLQRMAQSRPRFSSSARAQVDADTLEAVVKTGFDRQMVIDSLRQRLHNKATVAYYLILDNRRKLYTGCVRVSLSLRPTTLPAHARSSQGMLLPRGMRLLTTECGGKVAGSQTDNQGNLLGHDQL